jgi:hypothetical protein
MINHDLNSESSSTENERHLIIKTWQQTEKYDPYRGGQTREFPPGSGSILLFNSDGTIEQKNPEDKGTWDIKRDGKSLKLELEWPQTQARILEYEICELSDQILRIAWQGRHGMVVETYVPKADGY